LGSLLPDIDSKNSAIGRFTPLWRILKHRGVTHKIWFLIALTVATFYFFGLDNGLALFVGYFLHLLMDKFTTKGLKLL
jgi:membrane-bound metal-dependent hydrolase YbcI (DUF457 family)